MAQGAIQRPRPTLPCANGGRLQPIRGGQGHQRQDRPQPVLVPGRRLRPHPRSRPWSSSPLPRKGPRPSSVSCLGPQGSTSAASSYPCSHTPLS
eukprot:10559121-Heterocapsa_arctica.AAC.1